jgi:hypothetical protein
VGGEGGEKGFEEGVPPAGANLFLVFPLQRSFLFLR